MSVKGFGNYGRSSKDEAGGSAPTVTDANNGLSLDGTDVVLGQDQGEAGDPAQLTNDREIPSNGHTLIFSGSTNVKTIKTLYDVNNTHIALDINNANAGNASACGIQMTNDANNVFSIDFTGSANAQGTRTARINSRDKRIIIGDNFPFTGNGTRFDLDDQTRAIVTHAGTVSFIGDVAASRTVVIQQAAAASTDALRIQTSATTELFTVDNGGKIFFTTYARVLGKDIYIGDPISENWGAFLAPDATGIRFRKGTAAFDLYYQFAFGGSAALATFNAGLVVNELGADIDSRIEGDTDANLLYIDAGNDRVGIGTSTPAQKLEVNGSIKTAAPTGGAGAWQLGTKQTAGGAVTPSGTDYIVVKIDGVEYAIVIGTVT